MKTLATLLILVGSAFAQMDVGGGVSVSSGMGFQNPGFVAEARFQHRGFRILGSVNSANKFIGDGWGYSVRSDIHFGRKVSFGGGVGFSQTRTSRWVKDSVRPYAGGGIRRERGELLAHYIFPGTDRSNHLHGARVEFQYGLSARLWLRQELGIFRFHSSGLPDSPRHTGFNLKTSLLVRFGG